MVALSDFRLPESIKLLRSSIALNLIQLGKKKEK